jgi:outer membrane protein
MKKFIFTLVIIIVSMSRMLAQEGQGKMWSLHDCMQYAIENSRKAKIQEAKNDNKRLEYREAYLKWAPSISGGASATTSFGRSIDPETNIYTNTTSLSNNYQINANYTIFNGFSTVNNFKISKIARLSGVEESQLIEDDISLRTIQAYFNVLYRIGMVKITKEQLEESKQNYYQTQVMEELGLKGQADLLQVEAKMASDDYNYVKEQNNLENELISLKDVMFFPFDEHLQVDTNIVWIVDPFFEKESSDSIFQAAKLFLPSLKVADFNLRTAQLKHHTSKWQILPNIYAQGGVNSGYMKYFSSESTSTPFFKQLESNLGEYVGIGVNIPIFNALSRQTTKGKLKNEVKIAQYEKEQKLQEVATAIKKAVQEMEGSAKEYIQADKKENAQEIAHKANLNKYKEGLISVLDLQTSSNQLLLSKALKLNSALTYLIKTKVVNYYKGTSYIDQE